MIIRQNNAKLLRPFLAKQWSLSDSRRKAFLASEAVKRFRVYVSTLNSDAQLRLWSRMVKLIDFDEALMQELNPDRLGSTGPEADCQNAWDAAVLAMLRMERELFGVTVDDAKKAHIDHRKFCQGLMTVSRMSISEKSSSEIRIYNWSSGLWDVDMTFLKRLLLELVSYLLQATHTGWSEKLEQALLAQLGRSVPVISEARFDRAWVGLGNGDLNGRTGQVESHSPDHLVSMGIPVPYLPNSECPAFLAFLNSLFASSDYSDEEVSDTVTFLQQWFGYVVSPSHQANAMLLCVSPGASGKSTLFGVLAGLLGSRLVTATPLTTFGQRFGLMGLSRVKLALSTENSGIFSVSMIKAITAGEPVEVQRKGLPPLTQTLPVKIVSLTNDIGLPPDSSLGWERRLLILPFPNTFLGNDQDKRLGEKLAAEHEGILAWAIEGLKELIKRDYEFTVSRPMRKAHQAYFGQADPVTMFVGASLVRATGRRTEKAEVYAAYQTWLQDTGVQSRGTSTLKAFWSAMRNSLPSVLGVSYVETKSSGVRYLNDIQLRSPTNNKRSDNDE